MHQKSAKDALFDALAEAAKALANGRRAEIVDVLAQGERSVEDIAAQIDQSVPNTSHHLRVMARAGVLRTRREGREDNGSNGGDGSLAISALGHVPPPPWSCRA